MSESKTESTARWLANRLVDTQLENLSFSTIRSARRCLVDVLGCAAAGRNETAVCAAKAWAEQTYAQGNSTVWFEENRLAPVAAAFINATAASILDLDDGHRVAAGHPGAAIIPAVIAVAQERGSTMDEIILAIVAGYEVGLVCARLRSPAAQATVATGRWSTIGVAAALAKLKGLDLVRTRHALTIAESHAPNLLAADHSGFQGGHVKEGIPWSVITGFGAVDLASQGFHGYDQSFSNPAVYRPIEGAEDDRPLIETTYYKRYACCRWTHSAVDAALELRSQVPEGMRVDLFEVETFARAATLPNHSTPRDLIAAQFSLPFVVAAAWLRGADALLPITLDLLSDPEVADLAARIKVSVDPKLNAMYPLKVPARIRVQAAGATVETSVVSPVGDYDNPMSDDALVDKAMHLAAQTDSVLPKTLLVDLIASDVSSTDLFARLTPAGLLSA